MHLEDDDKAENQGINYFKSLYRSTINDTKVSHKFTKEVELCKMGKGLLLGIEDALLNRSKAKISTFTSSAICDSVKAYCFYFDKAKCWEKMHYLGCMDTINGIAKKDFKRVKIMNKESAEIAQQLFGYV